MKKRLLFIVFLFTVAGFISAPLHAQSPQIPPAYQAHYDFLDERLTAFEDYVAALPPNESAAPVIGAELIIANGNRGQDLLLDTTLPATELFLDSLLEIGVRGVSLQIAYPLLVPGYPQAEDYLDFFVAVAEMVRARQMKLMVETGPVFAGTGFSSVALDFSDLTAARYFAEKRDMLVLIATTVRPDYLALSNEPATEALITGIRFTPQEYLAHITETLAALPTVPDMLVGAGIGSWEDPTYLDGLLPLDGLDFINLHLYPLQGPTRDYLNEFLQMAADAQAAGKAVIVGETWLYKALPEELGTTVDFNTIFPRDVYSFWSPLDSRFVSALVALARAEGFTYLSFFWSQFFFDYVDFSPEVEAEGAAQRYARLNQAAFENILLGIYSPVGEALEAASKGD